MTIAGVFEAQAQHCADLGSAFMGQLLRICRDALDPGSRLGAQIFTTDE